MQRFDRNGPRICKKKAVKKRYAKGGSVRSGSDLCRSVYGRADRGWFKKSSFYTALTGCVSTQAETEKIRDMKYEVIEEEDIPQSLREMIKGGEKKPFRITYSDQGFLYIAQGYEVQPTTGYSVEVKELYETETAVCIKTTLIGPKKGEEKEKAETYPYIVVQTEDVKKDVLFK